MSPALSAIPTIPAEAAARPAWRSRRTVRPTLRAVARARAGLEAARPPSVPRDGAALAAGGGDPQRPARPAGPDAAELEALALGREFARHGLALPAGLDTLAGAAALHAGWCRGRVQFAGRSAAATPARRALLALRLQAWQAGLAFDALSLTPAVLARLQATHCPVTREPLADPEGPGATGAVPAAFARLDPARGVEAGHLVRVSRRAAQALDPELNPGPAQALGAAAAARLAALQALARPLPHLQAARLPLRVLPPLRLRVAAPVRMLQALLSRLLLRSGWSPRLAAWCTLLPAGAPREALQRFFPALLARVLAAGQPGDALQRRWAIEDAWADAEVLRLWGEFARRLDAAGIEPLLERAARLGLCELPLLVHPEAAAEAGVDAPPPALARPRPQGSGPAQLALPWSGAAG